jgi:hypothetical protein
MATLQVDPKLPDITPAQGLAGWRREFCIELHDAKNLPYPRITSLAAAPRTQRHVLSSITTLRLLIAAALLDVRAACA